MTFDSQELLLESLKFAQETANSLLSLSIAIITVSVTLSKDVFKNRRTRERRIIVTAWAFFLLSMICGALALLNITGNVAVAAGGLLSAPEAGKTLRTLSPYEPNIRLFFMAQLVSFIGASVLLVAFGAGRLKDTGAHS